MSDADAAAADAAAMADLQKAEASPLTAEDKGRVCRAAIASLNGRDPAIIRVISTSDDIHRVRYTRDDGTVWTNECRVGEGTAEWRMVENGQPGRWRTEDTIRFTVDGSTISINTFMGGEPMTSDTYTVE
jgi:hypothetical protein